MSWVIVDEADLERQRQQTAEMLAKWGEEARRKAEGRAAWKAAKTCPHCGQCPPIPPWWY